jgi:enoyl-CoA hydratase/carnithine racemase
MTTSSSATLTKVTLDEVAATVTLDDPDRRNALSVEMLTSLLGSLENAVAGGAGVIVLAANGPAFCAGLDLRETDPGRQREATSLLLAAMRGILTLPVPVIARVHGPARAAGLGLIAAADAAFAAYDVTFAFTEARLALAPAVISLCVLPRLRSRDASRLFLTGETVTAVGAADLGLIDEATALAHLDDLVRARAAAYLCGHPQGIRATKQLLTDPLVDDLDRHGDRLARLSGELFGTTEAREAIAAARRR